MVVQDIFYFLFPIDSTYIWMPIFYFSINMIFRSRVYGNWDISREQYLHNTKIVIICCQKRNFRKMSRRSRILLHVHYDRTYNKASMQTFIFWKIVKLFIQWMTFRYYFWDTFYFSRNFNVKLQFLSYEISIWIIRLW